MEKSAEKYPIRPPLTCIRCGKELKECMPEGHEGTYGMIDGGIVARAFAPYGSIHDGVVFQIGLCDDCVIEVKPTPIGNYIDGGWDEEIKNGANYYEEGEKNHASED